MGEEDTIKIFQSEKAGKKHKKAHLLFDSKLERNVSQLPLSPPKRTKRSRIGVFPLLSAGRKKTLCSSEGNGARETAAGQERGGEEGKSRNWSLFVPFLSQSLFLSETALLPPPFFSQSALVSAGAGRGGERKL